MQELCHELGAPKHLERERALERLKKQINREQDVSEANTYIIDMIQSEDWEFVYGGLSGSSELLRSTYFSEGLVNCLKENSISLLKHPEFRVRIALAKALGSWASVSGLEVYTFIKDPLFTRIFESFSPGIIESDDSLEKEYVLKGGAGWQNLETSFKTLQQFMQNLPKQFDQFIDQAFWQALDGACKHPNRFVREIGQFLCGDLCNAVDELGNIADKLVGYIADGLVDNWSQVRYAASSSVRTLLGIFDITPYESVLVPRMCINRYYVAEGVKKYSQETWLLYTKNEGRQVVARNAASVAEFYISQCSADNHAVREAACLTIAELASKVSEFASEVISSYAPKLLDGLIDCFKDESWPVRDAACLACGEFIGAFTENCKSRLSELKELWIAHLGDNIISVREHSAFSLCKAVRAYKNSELDFTSEVLQYLENNLEKVRDEFEFSKTHKHSEPQDQEMFSCGSLAPKLKRGGGCMDHGFSREKRPWEIANGCVFLLREISEIEPSFVCGKLNGLADLVRIENYTASAYFKRDAWNSVPAIAKAIGKPFKNNMEDLVFQMFRDARHENRTVSVPAEECIKELRKLIGPNIFKGRVEMIDSSFVQILESLT